MLKKSAFTKIIKDDDKYYAFNTTNGFFLEIDFDNEKDRNEFDQSLKNNEFNESNKYKFLLEHGILVKDTYVERKKFESNYYKAFFNNSSIDITLVPTFACNLKCSYCYQSDDRQKNNKKQLSNDIWIDLTYAYIEKMILKNKSIKILNITWFGGEPLLSSEIIKNLSLKLKKLFFKIKIDFHFDIITNGTIFGEKEIKYFKEIPIENIQITLDGVKEYHDKLRIFNNDKGTYDIILKNIEDIMINTTSAISIRSNVNETTYFVENFKLLINEFNNRFKKYIDAKRILIELPTLITDTENYKNKIINYDYYKNIIKYSRELEKIGQFKQDTIQFSAPYCTARTQGSFVIGPNAELYKCWEHITDKNYIVGDVKNGILKKNEEYWNFIGSYNFPPECQSCELLPICLNGCPLNWTLNKKKECTRFKDDKILLETLKYLYL